MKPYEANKFCEVDITRLVKADWNYKEENPELAEKLIENIKRNGQIENILIRELDTGFYEVVNGNHRYDAMKAIEAKTVFAYNLGKISDAKAHRIAIETNETKFVSDQVKLAGLISELTKEFDLAELIKTMPYNQESLDNYIKMSNFDWDSYKGNESSGEQGASTDESRLHFILLADGLELWNKVKGRMKAITPGITNYDILIEVLKRTLNGFPD